MQSGEAVPATSEAPLLQLSRDVFGVLLMTLKDLQAGLQQAAHGTQQVSSNIADVQRGASETGSASAQVLGAAKSLSGESDRLRREVGKFLSSVRAA